MEKKTRLKISAIASMLVGLLYLLLPIDIIPDALPVAGWIDDGVAILIAIANTLRLIHKIRRS